MRRQICSGDCGRCARLLPQAIRFLYESAKLACEPAGAVATAAWHAGKVQAEKPVLLVSGGNGAVREFILTYVPQKEQGEPAVGGPEDAGGQGADAVDQWAQAEVGPAAVWQQDPARPPVEEVGGAGGVEQERFEAGSGAGPEPFELEGGGRLGAEDLPAVRGRQNAGRAVQHQAAVLAGPQLYVARVQGHPHP